MLAVDDCQRSLCMIFLSMVYSISPYLSKQWINLEIQDSTVTAKLHWCMCICKQYTLFKTVNYSAFDNTEYTGAAGLHKTCTLKIENLKNIITSLSHLHSNYKHRHTHTHTHTHLQGEQSLFSP